MDSKDLKKMAKFLDYALGRNPDEFGLVPDKDGFIKLKELLKALNEESGWRHLHKNHLNELSVCHVEPPIEIVGTSIRATDRDRLPKPRSVYDLPRLLYTCVRTRAYPVVLEKGLFQGRETWIVLSPDKEMALRIGRRIDLSPVLLTINVQKVREAQIDILAFGQTLFLAPQIPVGSFTGPALPKEKSVKKEKKQPSEFKVPLSPPTPGSFFIDTDRENKISVAKNKAKGKKEKGWKEERRREKRRRRDEWP